MLLETALKDYLKSSLQSFPWPTSIAGWRDPASRGAQRDSSVSPKGLHVCGALPAASHSMSPTPATTAHPAHFLLFQPNFYQKLGWNDTTGGWSEKTCGPSISLLDFTSDSGQTRKLVHTVIILHQFTWNGFALCFQWAKFKFLSLSLCISMCVCVQSSSVAQSCPTLCHPMNRTKHTRPPCPSSTPGVYTNPCPSSQWCHPAISSSSFSSCPQSLWASGSFPISQLFAWGGQSTGVSLLTSVLPMNTQDWSPLGWTGWISLQSKGLSRVFSNTPVQKHQFFGTQLSLWSNSHIHTWPLEKTTALTRRTFVGKVMSLLFNMLSRLVITFVPRCVCLSIYRLQIYIWIFGVYCWGHWSH